MSPFLILLLESDVLEKVADLPSKKGSYPSLERVNIEKILVDSCLTIL